MLVPETRWRILARFLKFLITIAKRCSSTTLHLLRYIFSLWNVFVQKSREPKHFTKSSAKNISPSTIPIPSNDTGKGREVEAGPSVGKPYDHDRASQKKPLAVQPDDGKGSRGCTPRLPSMLLMLLALDHPGFIARALGATQRKQAPQGNSLGAMQHSKQNYDHETDVDKWKVFCKTFQKDVENINLLATVLLTANFSFLAINSIDQNGLSYWPQRLSYTSLLCALGSILMGLAVRTPRFFNLDGLLEILLSSHNVGFGVSIRAILIQWIAAIVIFFPVVMCLGLYWFLTEPQEKQLICSWEATVITDAEAGVEAKGEKARGGEAFVFRVNSWPFNPIRGAGAV
ncbi:hypothetical protein EDC04DRAFT_2605010 [Pisolithus marmoratus]|nr:hypothetical protein EDC04DRAFT_2605010 [Pisolithus marmoratus]